MNRIVLTVAREEEVCLDLTSKEKQTVDERALTQIGFTREEIALAKLFYNHATPAGVTGAVRYAVWALNHLPRADENGRITPAIYYQAIRGGLRIGRNKLADWARSAFRAHGREGDSTQPALFGILRKTLTWRVRFEDENPPGEWPNKRIEELLSVQTVSVTVRRSIIPIPYGFSLYSPTTTPRISASFNRRIGYP